MAGSAAQHYIPRSEMPHASRVDKRSERAPWIRSIGLVLAIWASLWAAGAAGSWIGGWMYGEFWAPDPPYTEEEIDAMDRSSPTAAGAARREQDLWEESVDLARSIAGLEGALVGTVSILAVWIAAAVLWLWSRERRRRFLEQLEE
jgi:hypothetical protein